MKDRTLSHRVIIPLFFLIFYLFFFFLDGAVLHADSFSYVNMDISREPVYPLFLAFLRGIFGEGFYLTVASLLQNLLNAFCSAYFALVIVREFRLACPGSVSHGTPALRREPDAEAAPGKEPEPCAVKYLLWQAVLVFILAAPVLLNRFVARRESTYSCSIMTEAITIPLWLFIFALFTELMLHGSRKKLLLTLVCVALLIATRKQMLVMLPLLFFVLLYAYRKKLPPVKRILFAVLLPVLCYLAVSVSERAYNYALHGISMGHTDSSNTFFTILVYASEEGDEAYLPENEEQFIRIENGDDPAIWLSSRETAELYRELTAKAREKRLTMDFAGENPEEHFSGSYDAIAIELTQPMLEDWLKARGIESNEAKAMGADALRAKLLAVIAPHKPGRILRVFSVSFLHGLCLTVARGGKLFGFYALLVYSAFLALMGFSFRRWPFSTAFVFGGLVLLGILGNVTLTSMVIFCQTRYMIYNMPLFYAALLLLIREGLEKGPSASGVKEADSRLREFWPEPALSLKLPEACAPSVSAEQLTAFPESAAEAFLAAGISAEAAMPYEVHIVIPAHNAEKTIVSCLNSVYAGNAGVKAVVTVINNGSEDGTERLVRAYQERLKSEGGECFPLILINRENTGLAGSRNIALDHPMGDYFLFLDGDDLLAPGGLELLFRAAEVSGADIIEGDYQLFTDRESLPALSFPDKPAYTLFPGEPSPRHGYCWGKLYCRALWDTVRFTWGTWYEDTVVPFLIFPRAEQVAWLKDTVYGYRQSAGSLSAKKVANRPRALEGYWVSAAVLREAKRENRDFSQKAMAIQLLHQLELNAERVKGLMPDGGEALFVCQAALYRELDPEGKNLGNKALSRRERALAGLFFRRDWKRFRVLVG